MSDPKRPKIAKKKSVLLNEGATKQRVYQFKKKTLPKIDEMIEMAKVEKENLAKIQRQVEKAKKELEHQRTLIESAPSAKEQAKLVAGIFKEAGYLPIKELIELTKGDGLDPKTKVTIHLKLAEYVTPKPKMIDTQKDEGMNLEISVVDFQSTRKGDVAPENELPEDQSYEEFTLKDDRKDPN